MCPKIEHIARRARCFREVVSGASETEKKEFFGISLDLFSLQIVEILPSNSTRLCIDTAAIEEVSTYMLMDSLSFKLIREIRQEIRTGEGY